MIYLFGPDQDLYKLILIYIRATIQHLNMLWFTNKNSMRPANESVHRYGFLFGRSGIALLCSIPGSGRQVQLNY